MQQHVVPLISTEGINYVLASMHNVFESVDRYMWTNIHIDLEMMQAVDYSSVVNEHKLSSVISFLSSNKDRYSDKDLLFLFLRSMISVTWKLDVLLLTHLEQCALANYQWSTTLAFFAQNRLDGDYFKLEGLPYWLRNTSVHYFLCLPDELKNEYLQMEVVMIKANDIQAQCKLINKTHIIALDCGIYTYLQEWCRIILHGFRIKQYCIENDWKITDPVKTGGILFLSIADTLKGNGSVYQMPATAMNFRRNDQLIVREIIENQIDFILGHEFGHIVCHSKQDRHSEQTIEFEADDFSMDMLNHTKATVAILNKSDSAKLPYEDNDIQSSNLYDKKVESVELLFAFYEMYYYVCKKKGYETPMNTTHPEISERRVNIRKRYSAAKKSPIIDYADDIMHRIQIEIDNIID